jgi:GxxExxY protein
MEDRLDDELTKKIIGLCFEVHNKLGPGFPERVYHNALVILLEKHGITYESEKSFAVCFENKKVGNFRCDLFIQNELILELKAVEGFMPKVFVNTLIAYLKASNNTRGLLVNFGSVSCTVKRVSNSTAIE